MENHVSADRAGTWLVNLVREHRLSPTQRRIIQYMLGSLPDVAFASTIDVAEAAGVSQPTVTRLATALGYAGYPEFRSAIREIVLSSSNSSGSAPPSTLSTALESERQNLAALEQTIGNGPMQRAVNALADARPLGILGLRASSALAEYLGYFARRVLPDVQVLNDAASMNDSILDLQLNGATAVLAFVMPRYPEETVRALAYARSLGMTTVAIVDSPLVPFAHDVDALLVAPVGSTLVFDSHAACVVLAISLLEALASRDPQRTQHRLQKHEELVETWAHTRR